MSTREIFLFELADNIRSKRFVILFSLIYIIGFSMAYESIGSLLSTLQKTSGEFVFLQLFTIQAGVIPSFLGFVAFFGPIIGMTFTFDLINREISTGTLTNILSQPVHRDSIINAKFLASIATISIMISGLFIMMSGIGIITLGTLPTYEEVLRIIAFAFISMIYLSLWMSIGVLFSIIFQREGTSALSSISIWLFFTVFIYMIYDIANEGSLLSRIIYLSPSYLYTESSSVILMPTVRVLGPVSYEQIIGMLFTPLPFTESLLLSWPYIVSLISGLFLIFIISYVVFIKKEIRIT